MNSNRSPINRRHLIQGSAATGIVLAATLAAATPAAAGIGLPPGPPQLELHNTSHPANVPVPVRVLDTRTYPTGRGGGRIDGGTTRIIVVDFTGYSGAGTPATVAAALTLTVVNTIGAGYLTLYRPGPDITTEPRTSTINWTTSGQLIAAGTTTLLRTVPSTTEPGYDSLLAIKCTGGSAHVIIDLTARWTTTLH